VKRTLPWSDGLALAGYGLLTVLFTYPLVFQLSTHLAGAGDDMWIFYWDNWWTAKALREGLNPYWTTYLYFPEGASLVYHSFAWLNTAQALLLDGLVDPFAAYNLVLMAGIALSGWGLYRLSLHLTGDRAAAFVAGVAFAFTPYRITQANHAYFITIWMVPLFLLFLLRLTERRRWGDALLAGLLLALTGLDAWQMFIYAWMMWGVYVVYLLLFERDALSWRTWGLFALVGGVAVALVLPLLLPLLRVQLSGAGGEAIYGSLEEIAQTDLLAFIVPNRLQPVYGHYFAPIYERFKRNTNFIAFVGFSVIGLSVVGFLRARRRSILWVMLAVFCALMALGPVLRFNGYLYPHIPTPHRLVGWASVVKLLKEPDRFNFVLSIPLAVLVGYGVAALRRRRAGRWRAVVPILSALVIGWEFLCIPMWTTPGNYPPILERMGAEDEVYGVLDLPIGRAPDKRHLYYQTIHGKPLVGGHISRPLPGTFDFIAGDPFLSRVFAVQPVDLSAEGMARRMAVYAARDIRYILLHKGRSPREVEESWREALAPWRIHEDEGVIVYATERDEGWAQ
jgi:hypothetical protein